MQILIEQYLHGQWIVITDVDVEDNFTREGAVQTVSRLTEGLANGGRMHLTKDTGEGVVIDTSCGPVRIKIA